MDVATDEFDDEFIEHEERSRLEQFEHQWMRDLDRHIWSEQGPTSLHAAVVLRVLLLHADANGLAKMRLETIARKTKIKRTRIVRHLVKKLEKDGWIQIGPMNEIRVLQQPTKRADIVK